MKLSSIQKKEKPVVIKGIHAVEEALTSGKSIEKIFIEQGNRNESVLSLIRIAREREIPVQNVPEVKLFQLGAAHQGIAAVVSPISFFKTEDIIAQAYERGQLPLLIICDRITDVRNFGAIARTAFAAGAHAIIIPQTETASINTEAVKSSAGALMKLPVCREKNLLQAVKQLKLHGIQILAAEAMGSKFIYQTDLKIPSAVILGSEGEGISKEFLKIADEIVKLPMANTFDSYNVSVAAGMILYEVMKQRMSSNES
ncbi:MAG TPA: 23S rRNA (guanosine(2251)-2'-O)-methyltransferase RlmB [Chitinophagales bacterium]|nr:23S rRNA (guanosine(2251)-2'-O)-methyltransferase RlmB [Chitinophagales bacterium]